MDLKICGIIDIILVLVAIIIMIIGYKKGFIKKLISLAGILVIIVFSAMFCGQFSEFMKHHDIIYPDIYDNIFNNILTNLAEKGVDSALPIVDTLEEGLGIPRFIASIISNGISGGNVDYTAADAASMIAEYLASIAMTIIAFFILAIGLFLIILILKIVADVLRTNKLIKAVDGTLGAIFYLAIYAVCVCVLFYILSLIIDQQWFSAAREWLEVDMMLGDDSKFRLSKAVYEGNILKRLLDLFI